MKRLISLLLLLFITPSVSAEQVLTFGIVPQQSASKLGPSVDHLFSNM